jgi:hypothetical protein
VPLHETVAYRDESNSPREEDRPEEEPEQPRRHHCGGHGLKTPQLDEVITIDPQ